jgi:hypothetical protein
VSEHNVLLLATSLFYILERGLNSFVIYNCCMLLMPLVQSPFLISTQTEKQTNDAEVQKEFSFFLSCNVGTFDFVHIQWWGHCLQELRLLE